MKDWKEIVGAIAPAIATAFGGPLAGVAVGALGKAILGNENVSESEIESAILTGLSPEAIVRMREADNSFLLESKRIALEERKTEYQNDQAYLSDTQDARKNFSGKEEVFWIGIIILIGFGVITAALTIGCWALLTGGLGAIDASTVGLVFGFLGTILGYVASNAQQVINYWFGTSKGSKDKTDAMVSAFVKLPIK